MKLSAYRSKAVWGGVMFVGIAVSGCGRIPARDDLKDEVARLEARHREMSLPGLTVTGVTGSFTRDPNAARNLPVILVEIVQEGVSKRLDDQEKQFTLRYNYALTYWDGRWESGVDAWEMERRLQQAAPVVEWDVSNVGLPIGFGGGVRYEPRSTRTHVYPGASARSTRGEIEVRGEKVNWSGALDGQDVASPFTCAYRFIFDIDHWTYVTNTLSAHD